MAYLKEGTKVLVHSLGKETPGEFRAIIRGVGSSYAGGCIYIVEAIDRINSDYEYSHYNITSSCVKESNWS